MFIDLMVCKHLLDSVRTWAVTLAIQYPFPSKFRAPLMHLKSVSYTDLRAHETPEHMVFRHMLEKK